MLAKIPKKILPFSGEDLPSLYFSLILFGQASLSIIANALNVENRILMLSFRFLMMALSFGFIFINLRLTKLRYFSNLWLYSLLTFWLLYLARLFFDTYVSDSKLAMPAWELLAWSLGSSLPIAVCTYIYSAQNNINIILFKALRYGVFMLGISIIIFLFNPGLEQGAFICNI